LPMEGPRQPEFTLGLGVFNKANDGTPRTRIQEKAITINGDQAKHLTHYCTCMPTKPMNDRLPYLFNLKRLRLSPQQIYQNVERMENIISVSGRARQEQIQGVNPGAYSLQLMVSMQHRDFEEEKRGWLAGV